MNKKLIIGMTALCLGVAVGGGVGGYFINNAIDGNSLVKEENVEIVEGYKDYILPEDMNYTSYSIYEISDNFAMFSSSTVGMYMLNKQTKEFTFFNSSYVSSFSDTIGDYKYFWLGNNNLFKINGQTGEYDIVALNSGVAFSSLSFIGSNGNKLFMKGSDNSNSSNQYYFLSFDTVKGQSEVFSITNSQYNQITYCVELENAYFLTRLYEVGSSSSTNYHSYLAKKEDLSITEINSYHLYSKTSYLVKDSKMYAVMKNENYMYMCKIDLTTGEISKLGNTTVGTGSYKFMPMKKGFIYGAVYNVNSESYSSNSTLYYISFEDDSITPLSYGDTANVSCRCFVVNGQFLVSPISTSNNRYGSLATFDEESVSLNKIYTALVSSSSSSYCVIYEFNGKYYVSSDGSNYSKMTFKEDGAIEFARVKLKCSITTSTKYELEENKYLFVTSGLHYYDFATDTYKLLRSGDMKIEEMTIEDNLVYLYVNSGVKYEFNLDTLTFKAVAYWEE